MTSFTGVVGGGGRALSLSYYSHVAKERRYKTITLARSVCELRPLACYQVCDPGSNIGNMMQKLNSLRLNGNGRPNFRSADLRMGMRPWSNRQIFVSLLFRFAETVLADLFQNGSFSEFLQY